MYIKFYHKPDETIIKKEQQELNTALKKYIENNSFHKFISDDDYFKAINIAKLIQRAILK